MNLKLLYLDKIETLIIVLPNGRYQQFSTLGAKYYHEAEKGAGGYAEHLPQQKVLTTVLNEQPFGLKH